MNTSVERFKDVLIVIMMLLLSFNILVFVFGYDDDVVEIIANSFIAGKYGKQCYEKGSEHFNIKYKKMFDSLEECKQYIKDK